MMQQFMAHLEKHAMPTVKPLTAGNKRGAEGNGVGDVTASVKKKKKKNLKQNT
jgi:hypothetical protein